MEQGQSDFIVSFLEEIEQVGSLYETVMADLRDGTVTGEVARALAVVNTKLEEAEMWATKALWLANESIKKAAKGAHGR